jgi:hypothetical protein
LRRTHDEKIKETKICDDFWSKITSRLERKNASKLAKIWQRGGCNSSDWGGAGVVWFNPLRAKGVQQLPLLREIMEIKP